MEGTGSRLQEAVRGALGPAAAAQNRQRGAGGLPRKPPTAFLSRLRRPRDKHAYLPPALSERATVQTSL